MAKVERDLVDVVILSWNRTEMTLKAVQSVLAQEGAASIVWVLDQGSREINRASLARSLSLLDGVQFIELGDNLGVAGGRNRGIACGTAEVVIAMDNDAELRDTDSLCHIVHEFRADPRLGALGFAILDASTGDLDRRSWVYPRAQMPEWQSGFYAARFCGAGHALRREAFVRAGGYDSTLHFYWEEVDLSNRMIDMGYTIKYDPRVAVLHSRAEEGRYGWRQGRFYYLVRNALYLDWKFFRSTARVMAMSAGYLLKGTYNGLLAEAARAIADSIAMMARVPSNAPPLGEHARRYIWEHDQRRRGSPWNRLRVEVLERLQP